MSSDNQNTNNSAPKRGPGRPPRNYPTYRDATVLAPIAPVLVREHPVLVPVPKRHYFDPVPPELSTFDSETQPCDPVNSAPEPQSSTPEPSACTPEPSILNPVIDDDEPPTPIELNVPEPTSSAPEPESSTPEVLDLTTDEPCSVKSSFPFLYETPMSHSSTVIITLGDTGLVEHVSTTNTSTPIGPDEDHYFSGLEELQTTVRRPRKRTPAPAAARRIRFRTPMAYTYEPEPKPKSRYDLNSSEDEGADLGEEDSDWQQDTDYERDDLVVSDHDASESDYSDTEDEFSAKDRKKAKKLYKKAKKAKKLLKIMKALKKQRKH